MGGKNVLPNIAESKKKNSKKNDSKKKESKKPTKKTSSKRKSKKNEKIYCGARDPIPKSYDRLGSMLECAKKRDGIKYWGVKKIDSKILKMINKEQQEDIIRELKLKQSGLIGKLSKLQKDFVREKDKDKKIKIKKEFEKAKEELSIIEDKIKKLKN